MTSESIATSTLHHKEISEISLISDIKNRDRNRIFWVTEGTDTVKTAVTYDYIFKLFLKHIKIDDLQVLIDYSITRPQIIKEMIVDYILYMRDEKPGKKLSRSSIKVHLENKLAFLNHLVGMNEYEVDALCWKNTGKITGMVRAIIF